MAISDNNSSLLRFALPKGRMYDGISKLLSDAGIQLRAGSRGYRPSINLPDVVVKILKPQSIVEMLHIGSRDIGFAGADWTSELGANLVEMLDTGLDPVRIVAAAPTALVQDGRLPQDKPLIIASEYEQLTRRWIAKAGLNASFVRSYGATEVFPPEDADCIVDNTATGATLIANGLEIIEDLMTSSTRLYANPRALEVPARREAIERIVLLLTSVLEARQRVMIEVNVAPQFLESVVQALPCMREVTVAPLHGNSGFALKAAVRRDTLHQVIPDLKARGGTDVIVTSLAQIVP